jgi:hypothetical protein
MIHRRKSIPAPRTKSIDEIAARAERVVTERAEQEREQRLVLARTLGNRAVNGERIGLKGFMAIGFPALSPDSKEYKDIAGSCYGVQRIVSGAFISIGQGRYTEVFGIKADAGDKGLSYSVLEEPGGDYSVAAHVLCTRAVYSHAKYSRPDPDGTMHGIDGKPYGVRLLDTRNSEDTKLRPVREIILAADSPEGLDQYTDGTPAQSESYTSLLLAAAAVSA